MSEKKYRNKICENKGLYSKYGAMKSRCLRKSHAKYKDYGGRGITICDEWLDKDTGFDAFADWALSHGYQDDLSIDRIDVDGNYCPENCRWATNKEQARNKQNTIWVDYHGERVTLAKLCEDKGKDYHMVLYRLQYMGMNADEAIDTPSAKERYTLADKCREHGLPYGVVKDRIHKLGWDEERALNTPARKMNRKRAEQHGALI